MSILSDYLIENNVSSFKNIIQNGDFSVWQRGESTGQSVAFSADRWRSWVSESTHNVNKTNVSLPDGTQTSGLKLAGTHVYAITQNIEFMFKKLHNSTVTLSFWGKASRNYTCSGGLFRDATVPDYISDSQTVNLTTSWKKFEFTYTFGDLSARFGHEGTFYLVHGLNQDALNLEVELCQVQLETNNKATKFEQLPLTITQQQCYRYFYNSYKEVCYSENYAGGSGVNSHVICSWSFPVEMRVDPNVTLTQLYNFAVLGTANDYIDKRGGMILGQVTATNGCFVRAQFDAEL